jgi:hypothetical protein
VLKKVITQPAKKPCLRLSKKGIWTDKTGFIDWNNIDRIAIQEFPEDKKPDIRLDFYFKHAVFEKTPAPARWWCCRLMKTKECWNLPLVT